MLISSCSWHTEKLVIPKLANKSPLCIRKGWWKTIPSGRICWLSVHILPPGLLALVYPQCNRNQSDAVGLIGYLRQCLVSPPGLASTNVNTSNVYEELARLPTGAIWCQLCLALNEGPGIPERLHGSPTCYLETRLSHFTCNH